MESEGAAVNAGSWTIQETLCLIICKEVLFYCSLPTITCNIVTLYRFEAESRAVKEMSPWVSGKRHLHKLLLKYNI